jgi:hypothetical protein
MTNINGSVGFSFVKVQIDSIVANQAYCHDNTSRPYTVNVLNSIGGGSLPHPGEHWTIDKTLGYWTFQCRIKAIPPTVVFVAAVTLADVIANQQALYNALLATGLIAAAPS